MVSSSKIIKEALTLNAEQKAELIDKLMVSLHPVDKSLAEHWAIESESRIDAFDQGNLNAIPLDRVLEKYQK